MRGAAGGRPLYPIFLDLAGRRCLVVGGGPAGAAKVERLIRHGALVRLVSPTLVPRLAELVNAGALEHLQREYRDGDLDGCVLAIAAAGVRQADAAVARDAGARGIPVSVAGEPELGSFVGASSVRRGDLTIAVSTGGASPGLARQLRAELEVRYGPEWGELAALLGELRPELLAAVPGHGDRRRAIARVLATDALQRLAAGDGDGARQVAREALLAPAPVAGAIGAG
ncbi:MAG: precorrin-2 dehydrogenase [Miltoncostaeaceae bacterium]|jgi:precorrin-2 dehydrogenase/sirohydrochlorin ferrochelatase|nr:precorrin-2 dehydrogenase [Miltoncostaeaceae bacterium]